jgi:hypothetical protein
LERVIEKAIPKLLKYAREIAPPMHEHITEAVRNTAFNRTGNGNGEIVYGLQGVVHTDSRLIPAINQI